MVDALTDHRAHVGNPFTTTLAQFDVQLANVVNCDPARDLAIIEDAAGTVVGFVFTAWKDREEGGRDLELWAPIRGARLAADLYLAVVAGAERHTRPWAGGGDTRFFTWVMHPGPDRELTGEPAWLESAGYSTIRFGAYLMRHHLDDIPELALPDGVEVRPVSEDQLRPIFDAHWEAFRGSFDHREPTEQDFISFRDDPMRDVTLWKIAWAGDTIVGQVKTFVNDEENARDGCKRGWTENIATHADWRNRGIAGALLAMSLRELRDRGFEQAALGVDTQNPGGAFQLYTKLGFALHGYEAIYAKPVRDS
jgi:ribosomal protein S18 acetylase RimI-like enzyme